MALGVLAHKLPVTDDTILNNKRNIIAIVGATGVGKTTTVAKLAARYLLRHGKGRLRPVGGEERRHQLTHHRRPCCSCRPAGSADRRRGWHTDNEQGPGTGRLIAQGQ